MYAPDPTYRLNLAGNPNTGKSTLFNALTGLRQKVGNWPGKTVESSSGFFEYDGIGYQITDLPGTYSLLSNSPDEEIARDHICFGSANLNIIVCDATALERNLGLVIQILEITNRAIVALNLIDEAERLGIKIDSRSLARELGTEVFPIAARIGRGIPELLDGVARNVGKPETAPKPSLHFDPEVEEALQPIVAELERSYPHVMNKRWIAMRLLEGDPSVIAEVERGTLGATAHP